MDLGCYGLHVMRSLGRLGAPGIDGRPSITRAHAEQRTPGVDAWCDVQFGFPGGATGLSANSMVADHRSFTIRIVGTAGDLLVHDFISPSDDDRLTINTPAGTTSSITSAPERRTPINWRPSPPTSSTALRFRSVPQTRWPTWPSSTTPTARQACSPTSRVVLFG